MQIILYITHTHTHTLNLEFPPKILFCNWSTLMSFQTCLSDWLTIKEASQSLQAKLGHGSHHVVSNLMREVSNQKSEFRSFTNYHTYYCVKVQRIQRNHSTCRARQETSVECAWHLSPPMALHKKPSWCGVKYSQTGSGVLQKTAVT